ncbi:hypothetical protein PCANC_19654 [Puccinia coronata f. sp. avenae]|uniref:Uncharacterized protein n=1 Tax=Puccinia coronata f. sp. avenae TaxID=200324 RepID=A0A2N5UHZ2_9BASI|nr:hypothetical protein PCANC_19654 [Puccinia coronata f. sp. avenae]
MSSQTATAQARSSQQDLAASQPTTTPAAATTKSDKDYIKCPLFTGNNFPIWKSKVSMFMRIKKAAQMLKGVFKYKETF